jgi:hypothetical protein
MAEEIFTIQVPFKGETIPVEIHTMLPDGPNNVDYHVWLNGQLAFTIQPHLDVCDEPCC